MHKAKTAAIMLSVVCLLFTGCASSARSIPEGDGAAVTVGTETVKPISVYAGELGISETTLLDFLNAVDMPYEDYIAHNPDAAELRKKVEEQYECTYEDYVDMMIRVNTSPPPSLVEYTPFVSQYSIYDAYIKADDITKKDDKSYLKDGTIEVTIADKDDDSYIFDVLNMCDGDFSLYMTALHDSYECTSAEITNLTLYGNHGITTKTEDGKENKLLSDMFAVRADTNEVAEEIIIPVVTLKYHDDETQNKTFALCNELGLIFKTTGKDSFDTMYKLANTEFQIRYKGQKKLEQAVSEILNPETTETEKGFEETNED
jgi:hypothetical protein